MKGNNRKIRASSKKTDGAAKRHPFFIPVEMVLLVQSVQDWYRLDL